jgi:hypothetical protein
VISELGEDGREIDLDESTGDIGPSPSPSPSPTPPHGGHTRAHSGRAARKSAAAAAASGALGEPGTATAALFGAVGERGAVDLATAFTRGFPQVASADPVWATVPFGAAGDAWVVLTIDATGHLTGHEVQGVASPALRAGVTRTVALIRARVFTANGATTRLHLTAHVTADQVHDGLHGDVFALGFSDAAHEHPFFALAIGRRIDVTITSR